MSYLKKGELLGEIEPIKYEMPDVQFETRRAKIHKEQVHLGSKILSNDPVAPENKNSHREYAWDMIRSVIAYNATYYYYWGQSPGLIKALSSSGQTFTYTSKRITFSWGLPLKYDRHRILEVSANLQPGTAVQVQASAQRTTTEVPYTAKLVSIFADGKMTKRMINGTYLETLLSDVSTDYGRPYFSHNGKLAPTTTSTTTSTTSTTPRPTTTPTPKTTTLRPRRTTTPVPTEPNPLLRFYPTVEQAPEEEMAASKNQSDLMLSDQGIQKNSKRSSSNPMTESLVNNQGNSLPRASCLSILLMLGAIAAHRLRVIN